MDWECAFLYNLWNNIPSKWSLNIKSPLKVIVIICMNPVSGIVRVDKRLLQLVDGIQGNH